MQETGVQIPPVPLIKKKGFLFMKFPSDLFLIFYGVHTGDFARCPQVDLVISLVNVHAWTLARSMCVDIWNLFHKCPFLAMSTHGQFPSPPVGILFPAGLLRVRTRGVSNFVRLLVVSASVKTENLRSTDIDTSYAMTQQDLSLILRLVSLYWPDMNFKIKPLEPGITKVVERDT
jgi:hypothetical protein